MPLYSKGCLETNGDQWRPMEKLSWTQRLTVGTGWPSPVWRLGVWIYQAGSESRWLGPKHLVFWCWDSLAASATRTPAGRDVNVFSSRWPLWPWLFPVCIPSLCFAFTSTWNVLTWTRLYGYYPVPDHTFVFLVGWLDVRPPVLAVQFVPKTRPAQWSCDRDGDSFLLSDWPLNKWPVNVTSWDWWLFLIMKWCQPAGPDKTQRLADWRSLDFCHSCDDSVDQPHDCMFSLDIFGVSIFFSNLYEN